MEIVADWASRGIIIASEGIFNAQAVKNFRATFNTAPTELVMGDEYEEAVKIIPFLVKKTSKKGLLNSYRLKHIVEKNIPSRYLSNGALIVAMIALGYKPTITSDWNSTFNCQLANCDANNGSE